MGLTHALALTGGAKLKREGRLDLAVGKTKQAADKLNEKVRAAAKQRRIVFPGTLVAHFSRDERRTSPGCRRMAEAEALSRNSLNMNTSNKMGIALATALALTAVSPRATYAASDSWIATKAKIALLTTDGAGRTAVKMDTDKGQVTLHGKVESQAVKDKAEATVRRIDGVTSVKNLLQIVPESMEKHVAATDKVVKGRVECTLKNNDGLENVAVDSVDNGVVLLSGKTATWELSLLAIEVADRVNGARRVASLITTDQK